ncbi:CRS2-associated factor 1, mitochondrial-like isoform X1 [Typha latifolia]|uniref:CRS2-associated factor 1, mitochondrial-like isoform X1 n=1 Tax=Typha latifolia TaxID=4733 RepID=UPI003C304711
MVFELLSHQKKTLASVLLSLRFLSSSHPLFSRLRERYGFVPPPSPLPQNPNRSSGDSSPADKTRKKKKKPPYRPPSSLDLSGQKLLHSDVPFDFRFSYTESNPNVKPIGLREPKYSPFGPGRVDRPWTGLCAPAVDPTLRSVDGDDPSAAAVDLEKAKKLREKILGEPLTPAERAFLIEKCQRNRTKRQVNLGRDGLTHNMLNDIHNNWKNAEAVRIKCLGVPTVDMQNVCTQLEEKTGGLIIHRHGGQIILYRGRHYNPKKRPVIPLMLWKPHEPIYPRLIKTVIDSLTIEETKEMRKKGLTVPVLTKLAKNGYYASLIPMVRDAFLTDELVRIDCKGLPESDYKKIGVKLRDLVPCVLVTFDKEQIVVWRGKNYNSSTHQNTEGNSLFPVTESRIDAEKNHSCILDQNSNSLDGSFQICTPNEVPDDEPAVSEIVVPSPM